MKKIYKSMILVSFLCLSLSACQNGKDVKQHVQRTEKVTRQENSKNTAATKGVEKQEMIVEVGGQRFQTVLYDNDTVKAFMEQLPMTLNMGELNGNEKFYYMDEQLPAVSENVGNIRAGDIMLYGSDCLVLFFEDFKTSYRYTKIGRIKDTERFSKALKNGTVKVSFHTGE